ncbi:ribonuclease catalytic domain-containing protein [Treponema phagedenis]|uniref:ribonuclease catalytic domain-containing protein n=1 Tax=Treponema phagedenis TaxID=162 RepID=UPI0004637FD5|nr:RNB domain-containing ribonuclease [Treponema phagedenis]QSH95757.1 RNB domain-containing ribonuclease [Treponema phagedenis]
MKKGNPVLYKNRPALIIDEQADKFEIETENGTKRVREKDMNLLHAGTVNSLKELLSAPLPSGNIEDALEFFEVESESFFEFAELVWGEYPASAAWAVWDATLSNPLFVCTAPNEPVKIRSKEELEALTKKQNEKNAAEELKRQFVLALKKALQGKEIAVFDCETYAPFLQEIEALALGKTEQSKYLKEAKIAETPESAHTVLLKTGFWTAQKNPYPARFDHSLYSSKIDIPPLKRAENITDLSGIPAFAIDNEGSTDPDDAISFDGKYLWIHVANPADTIEPDTKSDIDARGRGATLYAPEGASRMLGEKAIEYFALGLTPFSCALSFKIGINNEGEIISVSIERTKIAVTRMTYRQAEEKKDDAALKPLFEIARRNTERRHAAGAVSIEMPEVYISVDKDKTVHIQEAQKFESMDMVREMMLLAGEAAARFAFKNAIPFQYISQPFPELPKKLPEGLAGEYKKRRAMKPRNVGTIPSIHAALGIALYSQVTSPLRRYGDLVCHQQLLRFIDGKPLMPADDLVLRIGAADAATRNAILAERCSKKHWTLVYLLDNPDKIFRAIVLETVGNKAHIIIPALAYEADITVKEPLELNAEISVKAAKIFLPKLESHFIHV